MAAVLYGALLVCAYGFISLFSGRDVIRQSDVGPLVGPVMVFVACALVLVSALLSLRPRGGPLRLPWARAITTGLAVYLLGPLAGAVIVTFDRGDVFSALLFFADNVTGPFVVASAIVAIPVLLVTPLLAGNVKRSP
jgi:Family of unknown function (DUF6121)